MGRPFDTAADCLDGPVREFLARSVGLFGTGWTDWEPPARMPVSGLLYRDTAIWWVTVVPSFEGGPGAQDLQVRLKERSPGSPEGLLSFRLQPVAGSMPVSSMPVRVQLDDAGGLAAAWLAFESTAWATLTPTIKGLFRDR